MDFAKPPPTCGRRLRSAGRGQSRTTLAAAGSPEDASEALTREAIARIADAFAQAIEIADFGRRLLLAEDHDAAWNLATAS
jgi:hypothetical protein